MNNVQPNASDQADANRFTLLTLWWALSAPLLVTATWPLWSSGRSVPSIPAFRFFAGLPPFADYGLLVVIAVACAISCARPGSRSPLKWGVGALALLLCGDQLRWQPWAYHLLLVGVVLVGSWPSTGMRLLQWLAASVYVYSGIAKLDYAFVSTMGRQLIDAAAGLAGGSVTAAPERLQIALALLMPAAEAAIGVLLLLRRTRRLGLWLAAAMHLSNVVLLSPLGLDHRPGVLLWNIVFLFHIWILFCAPSKSGQRDPDIGMAPPSAAHWLAVALVGMAIIAPLTRPLGVWDRWPSWGLYSPGGEQTDVYVHHSVVDRLPKTLPLSPVADDPAWRRLELDDWMLAEAYAPLYPQRRITLALALSLHGQARLGDYVRVVLRSPANRITGERTSKVLQGSSAVESYCQRYWLNAAAR